MAEGFRQYIASIICTAAFCAIAISLTPKGRVQSAVKLACSLAMILATVSPIVRLDYKEYSRLMTKYKDSAAALTDSAEAYSDKLSRIYIQDACAAYILDKAENAGASLSTVSVFAEWSTEGYWYPVSAKIEHSCSDEERSRIEGFIEAELGIAKERQEWIYVGGDS